MFFFLVQFRQCRFASSTIGSRNTAWEAAFAAAEWHPFSRDGWRAQSSMSGSLYWAACDLSSTSCGGSETRFSPDAQKDTLCALSPLVDVESGIG